tara:strand:+ start:515 stop:1198 length:684 start_codon:yes stop_codon:yes gene_type:complete
MKFIDNKIMQANFENKNWEEEERERKLKEEWEKDREYFATTIAGIAAEEAKKIYNISNSISGRRWLTRLVAKVFERKIDRYYYPEFLTKVVKTPNGVIVSGKFLSEFDISSVRDGVHIFGEVRLKHQNDRILDFVILNKRNNSIKKYVIECQTNLGHLKPMEKHRDVVLARNVRLKTNFEFLEFSSQEIFYDSNISGIDDLIDDMEFGETAKFYNYNNNKEDFENPF